MILICILMILERDSSTHLLTFCRTIQTLNKNCTLCDIRLGNWVAGNSEFRCQDEHLSDISVANILMVTEHLFQLSYHRVEHLDRKENLLIFCTCQVSDPWQTLSVVCHVK